MDLYDLAERQHSVFHRDQAFDIGLSSSELYRLGRRGVIERCAAGVWRLRGVPGSWRQRLMVATLSVPGSQASHRAAARLRDLDGFDRAGPEIVVVRGGRRRRAPAGVRLHESLDLKASDFDEVDGIPCTSLVRTLIDLPAVAHEFRAGVAIDQCMRTDPTLLERLHRRHLEVARRGRDGTVALRELLAERGRGEVVDSGFERLTLRLIARGGLPRPVTQHLVTDGVDVCRLDIAWPDRKVAVECDSLRHHLSERAFRWERRRRRMLVAQGWTVLEFTYQEVKVTPDAVLRDIRLHLAG